MINKYNLMKLFQKDLYYLKLKFIFLNNYILIYGDWGLGIGDWGLGIGPNPQSPIPNPQSPFNINTKNKFI